MAARGRLARNGYLLWTSMEVAREERVVVKGKHLSEFFVIGLPSFDDTAKPASTTASRRIARNLAANAHELANTWHQPDNWCEPRSAFNGKAACERSSTSTVVSHEDGPLRPST
jgi:predicted lipoprotein